MNTNAHRMLSVLALLTVIIPVTAYAQTADNIPELGFLDPVTAGITEVATSLADNIIQILGALIILGIGYGAGKAVEKASKVILKKLFAFGTKHVSKEVMGDDTDTVTNPKHLIPLTLKWFVYIIFIIASVNALGFDELSEALSNLWIWIPNILASVIILILGTILVRFIMKWILDREFFGADDTAGKGVKTIIRVVIYAVVVSIAITQLGVGQDVIPTLIEAFAWGVAGAFALAVGLGLWKIIPEFISGKDNERLGIKKGNMIEIPNANINGTIDEVGVTKISIKLSDGKFHIVKHNSFDNAIITIKDTGKSE